MLAKRIDGISGRKECCLGKRPSGKEDALDTEFKGQRPREGVFRRGNSWLPL